MVNYIPNSLRESYSNTPQITLLWRFPLSKHPCYRICHFHAGLISTIITRQERIIFCFVMPDMGDNRQFHRIFIQTFCS